MLLPERPPGFSKVLIESRAKLLVNRNHKRDTKGQGRVWHTPSAPPEVPLLCIFNGCLVGMVLG